MQISLMNVEVFQPIYGKGIVIEQQINKIRVKFATGEKIFIINRKFPVRPKFENDAEIVDAFTEYDLLCHKIATLKSKISKI